MSEDHVHNAQVSQTRFGQLRTDITLPSPEGDTFEHELTGTCWCHGQLIIRRRNSRLTAHRESAMSEDRTYIRTTGAWHAFVTWTRVPGMVRVLCGRTLYAEPSGPDLYDNSDRDYSEADRIPSSGHLCGNCGRLIAAHTDIEA